VLKTVFQRFILKLFGEDGGHIDRPTGLDSILFKTPECIKQGEVALKDRFVDPVGPVRALPVTQHIRHVRVEAEQKSSDGHERMIRGLDGLL
jgi:hypothetical protein